jgi:2-C-methyl-D-erythritol 2,4-cyclodiphosphate synthase
MRIGHGWDLHRLAPGRPCRIGGLDLPHGKGPLGHSDGDVVLHALADALLGAAALGDIGVFFPDTDPGGRAPTARTFWPKSWSGCARRASPW